VKFEEVLPALRSGKKIRRKTWKEWMDYNPKECSLYNYDILAYDWEIIEEKGTNRGKIAEIIYNEINNDCDKAVNALNAADKIIDLLPEIKEKPCKGCRYECGFDKVVNQDLPCDSCCRWDKFCREDKYKPIDSKTCKDCRYENGWEHLEEGNHCWNCSRLRSPIKKTFDNYKEKSKKIKLYRPILKSNDGYSFGDWKDKKDHFVYLHQIVGWEEKEVEVSE